MAGLSCTRILYIMCITGSMVNYMLRVNLSIALVDMILNPNDTHVDINSTQTLPVNTFRFEWTVEEKNDLLGIFFWGYILTDILGGRLSELLGAKLIFGGGILTASLVTLGTPFSCYLHFYLAMLSRFALGMCLGITFPSMPTLAVKWIPPTDRSKFMSSLISQGLGVAITLPISGYLISIQGWQSVFYFTGSVGLLWSLFWFYLIYDSPAAHPRISEKEKEDIESRMSTNSRKTRKPDKLPFFKMILSLPVWSIIMMHATLGYCHFLIITQLPTYMKDVLKVDARKNGLLSSLPSFGQYIAAIMAGYIADKMCKARIIHTVNVRKMFAAISTFLPAILTLTLIIWGRSPYFSIIMIILSYSAIGCMSGAHLPNAIEISPNFSGTIIGLATTMASLAGALSTKTVGLLTKNDSSFETWKYVFASMVVVYIIGGLFFICFAKATVQKWNEGKDVIEAKPEESVVLEVLPK